MDILRAEKMQVGQLTTEKVSKKKSELMEDELDLLPIFTKSTNRNRISYETLEHIEALKSINTKFLTKTLFF